VNPLSVDCAYYRRGRCCHLALPKSTFFGPPRCVLLSIPRFSACKRQARAENPPQGRAAPDPILESIQLVKVQAAIEPTIARVLRRELAEIALLAMRPLQGAIWSCLPPEKYGPQKSLSEDQRRRMIAEAVRVMNEAFDLDPEAMERLLKMETPCNELLAKHSTVQVGAIEGHTFVRPLGLINGLAEALLGERIAARWGDPGDRLQGFQKYVAPELNLSPGGSCA
jgi:hypothetical protein